MDQVLVLVQLLARVKEKDLAVEPAVARVPTRAVELTVAQAMVRAQVLVRVRTLVQVLVMPVALLLISVNWVNCN